MGMIISEVYDAFIDAGASERKAKAAASVLLPQNMIETSLNKIETRFANVETRITRIEQSINNVKLNLAILNYVYGPLTVGLLIKLAFF